MDNCENIEMQQLRRMQELQLEIEVLQEQLENSEFVRKSLDLHVADLEEKCQALAAELDLTKKSEDWIHKEYDVLAAQMEIVHLIFGGNKCGGCG